MKILHVTQNYFPSRGGPQYTMKHVSEKLVAYYHDDVQVCTTNSLYGPETTLFKQITPSLENVGGVLVNRLPFNRWHYPLLDLSNKMYAKVTGRKLPHSIIKYRWGLDSPAINQMMVQSQVDVIMATTIIYNFADYPGWRFRTGNPKPFVLYGAIHLHQPLPAGSPLIDRAKSCDCYIANTGFEKDELVRYGVPKNKVVTIGTGIELDDFVTPPAVVRSFRAAHNIADTDVLVGYIGRLVKGKGVAILLDAFRQLHAKNKQVKLLLAGGTTDYVPEIKRVMAAENLPIILIESFDDAMKAVLYNALDIFVLASQSESFGVVFLEAWACHKPVVGSCMGAIQSLLGEGSDSLLFEPGSADSLLQALQALVSDPEKRMQLGANGYNKVVNNFTWEKIVAKYRAAYQLGIHNFEAVSRVKKMLV